LIFLDKLRTVLGLRQASAAQPQLLPVIDEQSVAWPFSEAAVDVSPAASGIYLLYKDGRLIYIGVAVSGSDIRQELMSHLSGAHGECTRGATAFLYEIAADPLRLYRYYLGAHRERYGGRLPPCNDAELGADAALAP
jgi:hypothetical protein